jgi:hypothetical protein
MAATRLSRVAARLVGTLGQDSAIAGGLAVNAFGYIRATRDVDVIVSMPLAEARRRLADAGIETTLFRGDVIEGDFPCLKGVLAGVPFDVLPPLVPIERERTVTIEIHRLTLPIVDFETLVRLKLKAGGPKDLLDLAVLVNLRPERRERTLQLAAYDLRLQRRLASLIDNPRVKRDAAERDIEGQLARRAKPTRPTSSRRRPKGRRR